VEAIVLYNTGPRREKSEHEQRLRPYMLVDSLYSLSSSTLAYMHSAVHVLYRCVC
jgi:hypothetical protein